MEIGDRVGPQTKVVTVISDDAPSKPTKLILNVDIQPLITTRPAFVYWRIGEGALAKRIEIQASASRTITEVNAVPNDAAVNARIVTIERGKKYALLLTPTTTARAIKVTVPCMVKVDGQRQSVTAIYASIMR
jgi:hypothetical protein